MWKILFYLATAIVIFNEAFVSRRFGPTGKLEWHFPIVALNFDSSMICYLRMQRIVSSEKRIVRQLYRVREGWKRETKKRYMLSRKGAGPDSITLYRSSLSLEARFSLLRIVRTISMTRSSSSHQVQGGSPLISIALSPSLFSEKPNQHL